MSVRIDLGPPSMGYRILVIDDDRHLLKALDTALTRLGYQVLHAEDGEKGLWLAEQEAPDLVILDLNLPGISGLDVCRKLRQHAWVPILVLSSVDREQNKIQALDLGADDYVTKPFGFGELAARIRALLRRSQPTRFKEARILEYGSLRMDLEAHVVTKAGLVIALNPKEFGVLECLASQPNRLLTRDAIIDQVWGSDAPGNNRIVDVVIRRLREKVEDNPNSPQLIVTVWGIGYKFVVNESR